MSPELIAVSGSLAASLSRPTVRPSELAHGLHYDVPEGVYHAREMGVASKSALDLVAKAPAVYRAWLDGVDDEPTDAMLFGRAFHCAILEPDRFAREYVVQPDFGDCRTKGPRDRRDAWRAENAGRTHLSPADARALAGMRAAAAAHPLLGRAMREGAPEVTARWDDPSGLIGKCRADLWHRETRVLFDLKTTKDPHASEFARTCAAFSYHRQQAFYEDAFAACGEPADAFLFAAFAKDPPYLCAVYQLEEADVRRGRDTNRRLLDTLADCTARDVWPGLPDGITRIALPGWAS